MNTLPRSRKHTTTPTGGLFTALSMAVNTSGALSLPAPIRDPDLAGTNSTMGCPYWCQNAAK